MRADKGVVLPCADVRAHAKDGDCKSFAASTTVPAGTMTDEAEMIEAVALAIATGKTAGTTSSKTAKTVSAAAADKEARRMAIL